MTDDRLAQYDRLVELHSAAADPLVMIRVEDLAALLNLYRWHVAEKPRVRRRAPLTEPELAEDHA